MRYLENYIQSDLNKKMVFLGGPRQCGKTTLAKSLLKSLGSGLYLNWDRVEDSRRIIKGDWVDQDKLIILDEIHKYKKWRNLIKGFYDTEKEIHQFLITGSARLDLYRRGGDSLLGRYNFWRLHPFSLFEKIPKITRNETYKRLLNFGGFPEPFLDGNERESRRWRESRISRIIREDVRDLEMIQNIQLMELFYNNLRTKVGSTLAISNLAQEVGISPVTAGKWLQIFEKMYLILIVKGYDKYITRAVHKPIKIYFFDNSEVIGDESQVLENLVATHLTKRNHFREDYFGHRMNLFYVKDKNQNEVDFLTTIDGKCEELVEVKLSDTAISPNLIRFAERLKVKKALQILKTIDRPTSKNNLILTDPLNLFFPQALGSEN